MQNYANPSAAPFRRDRHAMHVETIARIKKIVSFPIEGKAESDYCCAHLCILAEFPLCVKDSGLDRLKDLALSNAEKESRYGSLRDGASTSCKDA